MMEQRTILLLKFIFTCISPIQTLIFTFSRSVIIQNCLFSSQTLSLHNFSLNHKLFFVHLVYRIKTLLLTTTFDVKSADHIFFRLISTRRETKMIIFLYVLLHNRSLSAIFLLLSQKSDDKELDEALIFE